MACGRFLRHVRCHLVFEVDRFRVVHAVDVAEELLPRAPAGLTVLPLFGQSLLAVRPFISASRECRSHDRRSAGR